MSDTAIKYTWCYTSKTFSVLRALRHVLAFKFIYNIHGAMRYNGTQINTVRL